MPLPVPPLPVSRTVTMFSYLLAALLCCSGLTQAAVPPPIADHQPPDFTIVTPQFGSFHTGQIDVKLQYVTENEQPDIRVQLNGRTINSKRFTKSCRGTTCTVIGKLTLWDGLRIGENQLSAVLSGRLHKTVSSANATPVLVERTRFDYSKSQDLQGGQDNTVEFYTPVSIGLSTLPNGGGPSGNPWLQLTTGYPFAWNVLPYAFPTLPDSSNTVKAPYADISEGFVCAGEPFQAYVLGRENPYLGGPDDNFVETGACVSSIADLQSSFLNKMGRPLGSQDLVILGTTPGQTVPAGFDASPLGGTNYSQAPAGEYPQAYIMIGISGAAAGSAYESFNIPSASNRPATTHLPALNGTLMVDQNGNYNFIPSGDTNFQVHSDSNTGSSYITIGSNTYTPPPSGGNNFWLLVLDQETLMPVNYYLSPNGSQNCTSATPSQSCGATYTVSQDGGNALANELNNLSNAHDLIFLVSQGCPVGNPSQLQASLANSLHSIGGAPYSLEYQGVTPTDPVYYCDYSLVTANDGEHLHPLNDPLALSVGGAFSFNNQYGSLQGFLGRNQQGLYDVTGKAQMIPSGDANMLTSPIDYRFEYAASSQRQDWPLVDSPGPVEAYADISYQILNAMGNTGARLYDVRYYYTSSVFLSNSQLGSIIQNNLGTNMNPAPTTSAFKQKSWDTATPDQFQAALQQIGTELQQATNANNYLGDAGVRGVMAGSSSNIYANMIGVASAITKDYAAASFTNANVLLSKALNLTGSVIGLAKVIPEVGPIFGIVGGALRAGSGALALDRGPTPPSPEAVFDTTLSQMASGAETYTANMTAGYDGAVDNILSDSSKLTSIAGLISNSESGWQFPAYISPDQLQDPLVSGASRSLWLDIIPQLYGIRQFLTGPSPNPWAYGAVGVTVCQYAFTNIGPASYRSYFSPGSNDQLFDVFVFAESPNASWDDQPVSQTLAELLTTNTGTSNESGLNLPQMLLYGYSNMKYSPIQAPFPPSGPAYYCTN